MIRRLQQVLFGSAIAGFGITLFLKAGFGVDPISTLLLGILNFLPIRFGTASQGFNVVVLVVVFLLDRRKIGWGSLINALSVGFFINLCSQLSVINLISNSYILVVVGPILLGIGTGIYLEANLGCGALEGLMMILSEKTKISVKYIRMGLDLLLVLSGFLLGSPVGFGTIIGVLVIGPAIEYTLRFLARVRISYNKFSSKQVQIDKGN